MDIATYEQIAGKAEWEGGLDEALDWFKTSQVPTDLQELWAEAQDLKVRFRDVLSRIDDVLYTHGVSL